MRKELELIQQIEDYLSDRLSAEEKAAFESRLANDAQLQQEVRLQQEVMQAVARTSLKQQIQQAGKQFIRRRQFTRWGLGGLAVVVVGAVILYFVMNTGHHATAYDGELLPQYNELGTKEWADADKNIPAQVFTIQAGRDTVIETRGGIVLAIPANGFLDENSQPVTGPLSLVVKEALDAVTVTQAGLSTSSGNQLLETGGMFFIDARKGKQLVKINPAAGIHAEIPADTIKPGMQLYSGKRLPDGRIDWVNPMPLEKDLLPVDILSLDFYPPRYLDSLKAWGYNNRDKAFTDSLYYAMAAFLPGRPPAPSTISTSEEYNGGSDSLSVNADNSPKDTVKSDVQATYFADHVADCVINPAKIKAIWSNAFQNTLLATREFQERITWIHRSFSNEVLDLYVHNLDKPLWYIDSLAALKTAPWLSEKFQAFAARKEGKVRQASPQVQILRDYYESKTKAYMEAVSKTNAAWWNQQAALDSIADQRKQQHQRDSLNRVNNNFRQELTMNLKEAARQLGYDSLRLPPAHQYAVQVVNTGWYNIDRAVVEATLTRTTLNATDPFTGKKAVIQYLPVSFQIDQSAQFDRLYVYLLPDSLTSFMRVEGADGRYEEKLNELMKYDVLIIGYKENQAYWFQQTAIQPKAYTAIPLSPISSSDLEIRLNRMGKLNQGQTIQKEQEFFHLEVIDQRRRDKQAEIQILQWRVLRLLSGCEGFPAI